jgi:uncharacterized cofD-like protein
LIDRHRPQRRCSDASKPATAPSETALSSHPETHQLIHSESGRSSIRATQDAEIIIIGPGSLFTSILPNLLVPEIADAIRASVAPKIYVCNVMTQTHETDNYKASDHLRAINRHAGAGMVTHVLVNTGRIPEETRKRYAQTGAHVVEPDVDAMRMLGVRPLRGSFIDVTNVVRHNPRKLASMIFRLAARLG